MQLISRVGYILILWSTCFFPDWWDFTEVFQVNWNFSLYLCNFSCVLQAFKSASQNQWIYRSKRQPPDVNLFLWTKKLQVTGFQALLFWLYFGSPVHLELWAKWLWNLAFHFLSTRMFWRISLIRQRTGRWCMVKKTAKNHSSPNYIYVLLVFIFLSLNYFCRCGHATQRYFFQCFDILRPISSPALTISKGRVWKISASSTDTQWACTQNCTWLWIFAVNLIKVKKTVL